jgi:hypothetical protein
MCRFWEEFEMVDCRRIPRRILLLTVATAVLAGSILVVADVDRYNLSDVTFAVTWVAAWSVLITLALTTPFIIIREVGRWLLREHWKTRFIRISFDIALLGLIVLCAATISPDHGGHLPGFMSEKMDQLYSFHKNITEWPQTLDNVEFKLKTLMMLSWFLEHFAAFVILPGCLSLLAGYSFIRAKRLLVADSKQL